MKYKVSYKRRSDRNPNKWTAFDEVCGLKELYDLLRWLEKNCDNHQLIAVAPVSGGRP